MTATPTAQIQILADALVATGRRLWSTSLNNTPGAQLISQWMRVVAPGHFVLEITSIRGRSMDRVGELLSITADSSGHGYKIRTIDGREFHWTNAEFVRIPRSEADNREIFQLQLGKHAS